MKNNGWIITSLLAQCLICGRVSFALTAPCNASDEKVGRSGSIDVEQYSDKKFDLRWKLVDPTNSTVLLVRLDLVSAHSSVLCNESIDYVIMPDDGKMCFTSSFCTIYTSFEVSDLNASDVFDPNNTLLQGCNMTRASTWPPELCMKRQTTIMGLELEYQFLNVQSRSTKGHSSTEQEITRQNTALLYALLISTLTSLAAIIAILVFIKYKKSRKNRSALSNRTDINPYAVHVSLQERRGNSNRYHQPEQPYDTIDLDGARVRENRTPGYHGVGETLWSEGPRNVVLQEDANAYLLPMSREQQYHEIILNPGKLPTVGGEYDKAQDVPQAAYVTGQGGYVHAQDVPTPKHERVQYSEVIMAPDEDNNYIVSNKEKSPTFAIREIDEGVTGAGGNAGYGEIIGTIDHGELKRFRETDVKYKSVRKKAK